MADEDKIAPIESRAVVELVDRLRESYNEGQDDGMSEIERKWTAEDWRKWALGLVGAASTSKSARRAIEQAVREATSSQGRRPPGGRRGNPDAARLPRQARG
jgi:hypothetical protein